MLVFLKQKDNNDTVLIKKKRIMCERIDVLVIGAGPAGTVAAAVLKENGFQVEIVEKQQFPRFVIGESLIPSCMEDLQKAGFLPALQKQGFEKKEGARFIKKDKVCLFDFSEQYSKGWTWTWQMPRADFDKVLADEVEKKGVPVYYKTAVTAIDFEAQGALVRVVDSTHQTRQIAARFVIDASGYGRVLPRLLQLDQPVDLPPREAIFTHIHDTKRPEGLEGTQITFVVHRQDVWIWIIPFSNGITSVGFVGSADFFKKYTTAPAAMLRTLLGEDAHFCERFADKSFVFTPKHIKAYSVGVSQNYGERYAITGNSAGFLDPVFSSGVAFATKSGRLAATLAARQLKGESVDWGKEYEGYLSQGISTFQTYVEAWYDGSLQDIFFAENVNMDIKNRICSVLAGYVWDESNVYVRKHKKAIKALAKVVGLRH